MNFVQIIATLRKFGNYLAGLFPVFVVVVDFFSKQLGKVVENPLVAPWWKKITGTRLAQSIWKYFERFYWRTYSKDRLDLEQAPPEMVALLRPIFQLCAALCVLIPLTQYAIWPVAIEAFSGFKGTAPAWSVVLWLLSLPCAWTALLIGTAMSNRIAFALTACAAASFLSTCVILLPRSFFNALAPLAILIALAYCERTLKRETKVSQFLSVANSIVSGIAAGFPLMILTPIRPMLGTVCSLPGPVISIGGGAILGSILGVLVLAWARLPEKPERPLFFRGSPLNIKTLVWTLTPLLMAYLFAGTARGGLDQSGGMLISSLSLTNGYLWPVWYFVGVGILHKLMGSSKVVSSAIEGALPKFILAPLLIVVLLLSTVISFSEKIALSLSTMTGSLTTTLLPICFQIYKSLQPMIWSNPLNTMTVHWLSWVFVADLVIMVVLAIQKKLTTAVLVRLLFMTSFAALLIWEYVFQMSSFMRAPSHSVTALFFFAIWLLWLMHTVGWGLSSSSSPCWPAAGRLAVYSGVALIAILDIHARSACKDFKLMNELFLTMFRGVIDVGLPYYFLVWTSKKVETLPVKLSTLLGLFSLGALTSFCFNILEKLAGSGWNFSQLGRVVNAQKELLQSTGSIAFDLILPSEFFLIRALAYTVLLMLVYGFTRKRTAGTADSARAILFTLVAFASGIASFSKTLIELPIPPEARALIAPSSQELLFNCNLFQNYLAYWIPALLLGVTQLISNGSKKVFLFTLPFALAGHALISWLYADNEVFLRASGSLYTLMVMLGGVFVILVAIAIRMLSTNADPQSKANLLTPRAVIVVTVVLELLLAPMALFQSRLRFEDRRFAAFQHPVKIASSWLEAPQADKSSECLMRMSPLGGNSRLMMGTVASENAGTRELLKKLLVMAAQSKLYPNLQVISIDPWDKYFPGALACGFSYELPTGPVAGLSVLVPRNDGETEYYSLHTNPSEITHEQWELAYSIKSLRESFSK